MGKTVNMTKASFGVLFTFTILSFLFLSTNSISAANTAVSDIYVTVPISCNIITTLDSPHTAIINPGQSVENIGTTTFNVFCNDNAGYAIYAIGYSNQEYGNTNMIATVGGSLSPSNNIATGLTTSGTSSWSMKLNAVTGTYAPTIVTGFDAYHVVPDTYTKVAYLTSSTDYNTGSSLQSTYKGYISSSQPSGTYNGKVKYTIVHPNDADAPTLPVVTNPGYISYNPNASGVVDSMGDQSITSSATSAELWASNFQRANYGFAGWSDKFDWVLNENDANGNGTGENLGYHIYGPNATITFTAGQYSGTNPGLSLYAVWVPSQGYMQDFTTTQCSNIAPGNVIGLKDKRDNQVYAVAKLADNKCWMIENLRLDNQYTVGNNINDSSVTNESLAQGYHKWDGTGTDYGDFIGLADPETANFTATLTSFATANSLYSTTTDGNKEVIKTTNYPSYRFPRYNNQNTASPASNMTAWNNDSNTYSVGNWYTLPAAVADTSYYPTNNKSITATSICPTNWHLPTGGDKNNASNSEFWQLIVNGIVGAEPANMSSEITPYYTGNYDGPGPKASKLLRNYPNNFIYSGTFSNSSPSGRSSSGCYCSSSVGGTYYSYYFSLNSRDVYPGTSNYYRSIGRSIRCLIGS